MLTKVGLIADFITDCRDNALDGLKSNSRYNERTTKHMEISEKLEAHLSYEAKQLFEDYKEIGLAIMSMEFNTILLCGLSLPTEMSKYLDPATEEYKVLVNVQVQ